MASKKEFKAFSTVRVPNKFPTAGAKWRIAVVGEAPGETETLQLSPFVGASGYLLERASQQVGIKRSECFFGNIFQYQPYANDIETVDRTEPQWQESLDQLAKDLSKFKPNIVVLLGNTPLETFTGNSAISNWRGSIIEGKLNGDIYKCLPTFHPAYILRTYSDYPQFQFDLERASIEGQFPEIRRRSRTIETDLSLNEIIERFRSIPEGTNAFDIEGGCRGMHCISIATSPDYGFNIPFLTRQGNYKTGKNFSVWSRADEIKLYRELDKHFRREDITFVGQNAITYDQFVLAFAHGLHFPNQIEDTMILNWELFPEQPKSLGFQNSIWTTEPYYKGERKSPDDFEYWRYCGKDSCTTLEIWEEQNKYVNAMGTFAHTVRRHYEFNRDVQRAMLYCSLRGMNYDENLVLEAAKEILKTLAVHQKYLDEKFGSLIHVDKKVRKSKKNKMDSLLSMFDEPVESIQQAPVGHFNVNSGPQRSKLVYSLKGYTYSRRGKPINSTTDEMALLTLANKYKDQDLWELIKARRCRTALSSLGLNEDGTPARKVTDKDNRVRFSYSVVGTDTGRTTCSRSNSGSGFNGQTITKTKVYNMRKFYRADPGHLYFQGDLEGADSWTVAAHCAKLGDDTMLRYLHKGIKPAKVLRLTFIYSVADVLKMDLDELKVETKAAPDDVLYTCCKKVTHGTSYKMGPRLVGDLIFKDTDGDVMFSESECKAYQKVFLNLFPGIQLYHNYIFNLVSEQGYIQCASGHMRTFLAIRWTRQNGKMVIDHETHRAALSTEPQSNTTYVTNRILHNLYYKDYNHTDEGFILEPLHQVHDAVNGQCRTKYVASGQLTEVWNTATDIELTIAGIPIRIPVEARLGPSWGEPVYYLDGTPVPKKK